MLREKINEDFLIAFKAKDAFRKDVLNMLKSAIKYVEIDKGDLSDDDVVDIIGKEVKKRKDSISQYEAADRSDLAENEANELTILMEYMPEQLDDAALGAIVDEVIAGMGEVTEASLGAVMGQVMGRVKGKADGNDVSRIVKEKIS